MIAASAASAACGWKTTAAVVQGNQGLLKDAQPQAVLQPSAIPGYLNYSCSGFGRRVSELCAGNIRCVAEVRGSGVSAGLTPAPGSR